MSAPSFRSAKVSVNVTGKARRRHRYRAEEHAIIESCSHLDFCSIYPLKHLRNGGTFGPSNGAFSQAAVTDDAGERKTTTRVVVLFKDFKAAIEKFVPTVCGAARAALEERKRVV